MKNFKKFLYPLYILFVIAAFFIVKNSLNDYTVDFEKEPEVKETIEVKPVNVTLIVKDLNSERVYKRTSKNTNTLLELLEQLRLNDELYFEINYYTFGPEIVLVNGVEAPKGYMWKYYLDDRDVTLDIEEILLIDDGVYELRLEEVS